MRTRPLAFAATALLALAAAPAMASSVSAFSGNTQPSKGSGDAATVNFAVYSNSGTAGDTFGTGLANFDSLFTSGSATFDTSANYLYLYQTVANEGLPVFLTSVGVPSGKVTSFGYFAGTSFSDDILGTPAGLADPSPASTGASPTILGGQSGLSTPNLLSQGSSSIVFYDFSEVPVGGKTVLWGYTSNFAPGIGSVATSETIGADGQAAIASVAVPLPAAFWSGLSAIATLALVHKLRRPATA